MHNNQKLKKLAHIAANSKAVPTDIENFVLRCLSKQELKSFLHFYKEAISKNRVFITSAQHLTNETVTHIKNLYNEREVITIIDESLGAGIKLQHDDLVVDFTFKNYINDTIEKLKN